MIEQDDPVFGLDSSPTTGPTLIRCSADVCGYNALGVVTTVTLDDLPDTEFLAVTLSPRPIIEDETAFDEDDSSYLCRHHLAERIERHLQRASRQAPMRVWA